ncbi:MAG: LVIVD repeat-containing protein [Candidatus Krumholzibacteriia bacterium]
MLPSAAPSALAQSCLDYGAYLHWTGTGYEPARPSGGYGGFGELAAEGETVVTVSCDSRSLTVLDVSAPEAPRVRGRVGLPAQYFWSADVALTRGRACVSQGDSGLVVVDVRDPDTPVVVGRLAVPYTTSAVAVSGDLALVACRRSMDYNEIGGTLFLARLAVDGTPVAQSTLQLTWPCERIAVAGMLACIVGRDYESRLTVVDFSDPAAPWVCGVATDYGSDMNDVAFDGVHAFVAGGDSGLVVYDVSDPSLPRKVGACRAAGGATRVTLSGDLALVLGSYNSLHVVDVSAPESPREIGAARTTAYTHDVAGVPGGAVVTESGPQVDNGTAQGVVRFYAPGSDGPQPLAGTLGGTFRFGGIAVAGDRAYATNFNTITVARVTTSGGPVLVRELPVTEAGDRVATTDDRLYVGGRWDSAGGGKWLRAYARTDPDQPTPGGRVILPDVPRGLAVAGVSVFAACGDSGLVVVEASDLSSPRVAAHVATPGAARGIALSDGKAYIADSAAGLCVFDVGDPAHPTLVGRGAPLLDGLAVTLAGNHAYVLFQGGLAGSALPDCGVAVFDIGDPATPLLVGAGELARGFTVVAMRGGFLHAAGPAGLAVVDACDPSAPRYVGGAILPGRISGLANAGDLLYLAGDEDYVPPGYGSAIYAVWPQCGSFVAVEVREFTARVAEKGVDLRWVIDGAGAGADFRIVARRDREQWTVAGATGHDGVFTARDGAPQLLAGGLVVYALQRREGDGAWTTLAERSVDLGAQAPLALRLLDISPNPFNPCTEIRYLVPRARRVQITIHDLAGRLVATLADADPGVGEHVLRWEGKDDAGRPVSSGTYIARLADAGGRDVRKLTVAR